MSVRVVTFLVLCVVTLSCASDPIHPLAARIGTGVNLGNALESAPNWTSTISLEEEFFALIKEAGFDSVRLPVRWSAHASQSAPYLIEAAFLEKVDWAISQALRNDLLVVLNMHHYLELFQGPVEHRERFLGLWRQVAEHYRELPNTVFFEPLNEPNTELTPDIWNQWIPEVISVIRESNPDRGLVIDVAHWSNVEYTPQLVLPEEDRNLIISFHYYSPHTFTHQGTSWSEPKYRDLSGIMWLGTEVEKAAVTKDLMIAFEYAKQLDRPLYLGEFGAYSAADMDSRIRWTSFVADEARRLGMTIAYWEFCASFGLYDIRSDTWRTELLEAVLP